MRSIFSIVIAVVCSLPLASEVRADDPDRLTVVYVSQDPLEIAKSVGAMLSDLDIKILPNARTGALFVRGATADVEKVSKVIQTLDVHPEVVNIDVSIAVTPTNNAKEEIVDNFRLTTLGGTEASVQVGQEISIVVGQVMSPRSSKPIAQTDNVTVGTMLEVVPEVRNGKILMSLAAEKSWVETSPGPTEEALPNSQVFTSQLKTKLALKPGEKETIEASANGRTDSGRRIVLTISATLGKDDGRSSRGASTRSGSLADGRSRSARSPNPPARGGSSDGRLGAAHHQGRPPSTRLRVLLSRFSNESIATKTDESKKVNSTDQPLRSFRG